MFNYEKFDFSRGNIVITKTARYYAATASGKGFKSAPEKETVETVTDKHYTYYIQSVPFFNKFGNGASCRATWDYTLAGYIPVKVVTVSPGRETKVVVTFSFDWKGAR